MPMDHPLRLEPTLHVKVWGGRKLSSVMHKALPSDAPYGESWELHDTSTVDHGPHAGRTLGDLLAEYGVALIGTRSDPAEGFPLLAKLLDAADWLSVQVHPNDAQARQLEGQPRGKTEAWVLLAADPDARLVIGVTPGTAQDAMAAAIRDNTLEDLLVYAEVHAGDVLYMPAGTVHAIGPGCLIYEIQQSSNTTYRLYDWGRMGLDGQPRPLHIDKGVQVSNLGALPPVTHPTDDGLIVDGAYFRTYRHTLREPDGALTLPTSGAFQTLTCISGTLWLEANGQGVELAAGRTAVVPAAVASFTLSGQGTALRSVQWG